MSINLFQKIDFISHAGLPMKWKIECDALTENDWECLTQMIIELEPQKWRAAVGIPRGGIPLGMALNKFGTGNPDHPILIADDVYTTGTSFKDYKQQHYANEYTLEWCVFARKPTEKRVKALFTMPLQGSRAGSYSQMTLPWLRPVDV